MISFEEKYMFRGHSVRYRTVTRNYLQVIRSVDPIYQGFIAEYILAWLQFVKEYRADLDPAKHYTAFNKEDIRREKLYPRIECRIPDPHTEADLGRYEIARVLDRVMCAIDNDMLDRLEEHYKRHEFAEPPAGTKVDIAPFPIKGVYFKNNNQLLSERQEAGQLLIVAPLILSWEYSEYSRTTHYTVFLPSGMALVQSTWWKAANRFKDPLKRHAQAIEKTQRLAPLTDWEMVEQGKLSNAQQRRLSKLILAEFKEGWE